MVETTENQERYTRYREETYWISGSSVNFRKKPNTNGEIIGRLVKGTEVVKTDEDGDWLYIRHGETRGYIHKDYVSSYPPINSIEGEVDPEYYINQNKNIRTFYDPENPNYNEKDIRDAKKVKIKENLLYGFVIVIMLLFFAKLLFL